MEDSIDRDDEFGLEESLSCIRLTIETPATTAEIQKLDPGLRRGDGSLPFAISQGESMTKADPCAHRNPAR